MAREVGKNQEYGVMSQNSFQGVPTVPTASRSREIKD